MAARQLRDLPLRRAVARDVTRGATLAATLAATLVALAAPTAAGGASGASRSTELTVATGGTARRYRLHVPPGAAGGAARPLVVAFHGFHGAGATTAQQERASGLSALTDRAGFVVAYPEGAGRRWATTGAAAVEDVRFVRDVIADVARTAPGVTTHAWRSCAAGTEVVLHLLDDVGHGWPRDASATIWEFLRERRVP